jgi:hypothetical protein
MIMKKGRMWTKSGQNLIKDLIVVRQLNFFNWNFSNYATRMRFVSNLQ